MPDRYYSAEKITSPQVTLSGSEAHHLLHVMRAQPGLELILFDGFGGEFVAEVAACQRATVEVTVGERLDIERELPLDLTLAVSMPKGDRQRWLVEKSVELGVKRLIPLQTSRSVGKSEKANKLERYVIEASKQCGRNRLMEITEPIPWSALLEQFTDGKHLIAHPGGQPLAEQRSFADAAVMVAIGPEGGFTDEEVLQAATAGWESVSLGSRILRIETAATALISAITLGV